MRSKHSVVIDDDGARSGLAAQNRAGSFEWRPGKKY